MSKTKLLISALCVGLASVARADTFVLDSGVPDMSQFPLALDGNDYAAAEFSLGAGQTITGIQGYILGGFSGMAGDTFTVSLYAADGSGGKPGTSVFSGQATYNADGWNGLSGLSVSGLAAGNYWAAFEVGASDSTSGLQLPIVASSGTAPALAWAFYSGQNYQTMSGENFGVQVSAVPLPAAALLFGSGLLGVGGFARRRRAAA